MVVLFPENIICNNGKILTKEFQLIDISKPEENIISINKKEFVFTYLQEDGQNKGGNSIILKLYSADAITSENIDYGIPDLILKILKQRINNGKFGAVASKAELRFKNEIEALKICKEEQFENIINIEHSGKCFINNIHGKREEYLFYTMEVAEHDLKEYIELNHSSLSYEEKLSLCLSISKGLRELNRMNFYHRDIKPDNIFFVGSTWKIGDLGLIDDQDKNHSIDKIAEWVGPRGWMSPESMNKYLTENKGFIGEFNVKINHQSDIFQLGKVFWYIFQHNAPIGNISESDFVLKEKEVYPILRTMLNHSTKKRYEMIDEVIYLFTKIESKSLRLKGKF